MTNNAASEMKLRGALLGNFLDEHHGRIAEHYAHAIEKHLYFCDLNPLDIGALYKMYIPMRLDRARKELKYYTEKGFVTWEDVLDCEMWEVLEALVNGDKAHAVEELYDCVAVLLRTIDVLEGRQELGKQETNLDDRKPIITDEDLARYGKPYGGWQWDYEPHGRVIGNGGAW